jgi:chromosome partitioning protein
MVNMNKIAIINLKGGVGKSVTACNLACILAELHSRRVLVMDLDKQANSTKFFNRFSDTTDTMGDVLELRVKLPDVIRHTDFPGVDIAPSNMTMLLANKNVMFDVRRPQADRLKNALEPLRSEYDYCIFDCPPDIDMATINALVAADWVIIPVDCDEWALDGLAEIMDQVRDVQHGYNSQLEVMGVLATKYDRGRYSMQTVNQIANLPIPAFRNEDGSVMRINYSVKVKEAKAAHKPLHRHTPNIPSSAQYKQLAAAVKKIAEGE